MDILYRTPSLLIDKEVDRKEESQLVEVLPRYLSQIMSGETNSGSQTAILCSNTDGYGKFSSRDWEGNLKAAKAYSELFKESSPTFNLTAYIIGKEKLIRKNELIEEATSKDLERVIQDPKYKNIVVIGHASYHSWLACDRSVNWFDLANMQGEHLKNGLFLNVGCGGVTSWNYIPLGYFVVNNPKHLLGKKKEYLDSSRLDNPSEMEQLNGPKNLNLLRELVLN